MNKQQQSTNGITVRFLSETDKPAIYDTFIEAFSDYHIDMSYMTEKVLHNRAIKNSIRYDLSVGVFDRGRMVGFTQVGCGEWDGRKAAFDSGTGIIPAYRNRGLAGQMFDMIKIGLKEKRVELFILEVLKANEAAIRAYQRSGFRITREFEGLKIDRHQYVPGKCADDIDITRCDKTILAEFETDLDWSPSWEENFAAIRNIPDEIQIFTAYQHKAPVALLIYYPLLQWIMSLVVKKTYRRKGIGSCLLNYLFKSLPSDATEIKVVNIVNTDPAMLALFKGRGFINYADQFEMILNID